MTCNLRKKECLENAESCVWVVGKGCKKIPVAKKCKKMLKKECNENKNCEWVVRKGCKDVEQKPPPNILSNKDIISIVNKNLSFIDKASLLKAKNDKTLRIIKIATNKDSIPSYFLPYVNAIPVIKKQFELTNNVNVVVGSYHGKKFLLLENVLRKETHYHCVMDNICITTKSIFEMYISGGSPVPTNLDIHSSLYKIFDLGDLSNRKRLLVRGFQPRTFEKQTLDIKPVYNRKKYTFDLGDGVTFTVKFVVESVSVDNKTNVIQKVNGFALTYELKGPLIVIKDGEILKLARNTDVTPYWSKAYNAFDTYIKQLTKEDHKTIIFDTIVKIAPTNKSATSTLDTELIWKNAKICLFERPIFLPKEF